MSLTKNELEALKKQINDLKHIDSELMGDGFEGTPIKLQYDNVYTLHETSYSFSRLINFEGANLEALTSLLEYKSMLNTDPIYIKTEIFDVFVENGEVISRAPAAKRDMSDERIQKMLNLALEDYLNQNSYIAEFEANYIENWVRKKGKDLINAYALLFIMRIIESIIRDGGAGKGYDNDSNQDEERICAKIRDNGKDRCLSYHEYLNYFQFDIPHKVWEASFKVWKEYGDYMLSETMKDVPEKYLFERVLPAFYFSLLFLDNPEGRVRELFDYTFEMA